MLLRRQIDLDKASEREPCHDRSLGANRREVGVEELKFFLT